MDDGTPNDRAVIGGNAPPPDLPYDPLKVSALRAKVGAFLDAGKDWARAGVQDAAAASRMVDFLGGLSALTKEVEEYRTDMREPHLARAQQVQDKLKPLLEALAEQVKRAKALAGIFEKAEKARLQTEANERARVAREAVAAAQAEAAQASASGDLLTAAEAADRIEAASQSLAQAEAPVRVRMASASGGARTLASKKTRKVEVQNWSLAFLAVQDEPAVRAAIETALNARVRSKDWPADGAIRGCEIKIVEGVA